ncbi:MAG: GNAT family N-acetyltransferase, partial [Paraclostridium sp.]
RKSKFREFNAKKLRPYYGMFGSTWRGIFNKLENKSNSLKDNEIYIDLIVVDENSRGKGIASMLIDNINKFSIENNFDKILLDVVDTNEGAIKLYGKLGYNTMKTMDFKGFTDFMGYRKVMYMYKDIE